MNDQEQTIYDLQEQNDAQSRKMEALEEAVKALSVREERYRAFLENAADGCAEYDLNGRCTYCNEATSALVGCSRKEYRARRHAERFTTQEEARRVSVAFKEIYLTGKTANIIFSGLRCADGTSRTIEASVSLIRDETGQPTGFRSIARDLTDRIKSQAERDRYRDFVENVGDICSEYDLHGVCTFCNEAAVRLLGYSREELLNRRHTTRYASSRDADRVFAVVHETFRKRLAVQVVVSDVVCKDGSVKSLESAISIIYDGAGQPAGFRSIARDVTERRKMEKELERYRDFLENVEDSCSQFDLHGHCVFCNEAAHRMLGFTREEFMALHHHDRYASKDEVRKVFEAFNEIYRTGRTAKIFTMSVLCKDGTTRPLESIVSLIQDDHGRPVGFRNVARDITQHIQIEKERESFRKQLVQAQKLEAVGTLAGGVAHDFNNLLMGIQGYASLMLIDLDATHPHFAKLKAIETHVKSGAELTRRLLGYARGGRYEMKPVFLNEIVRQTADMFSRTKKEITLLDNLADDLWVVDADAGQMEQLLLNLFVNAWQAMPGGGRILVATDNVALSIDDLTGFDIPPGRYAHISVSDTGVGMDEDTRERLFEPFFTTKQMGVARGVGLGLASAYGIIRGHKGMIRVQSEIGQGATFHIYLPASTRGGQPRTKPEMADITVKGSETVLLVDDEAAVRDVVADMLRGLGYQVMEAASGEEAVGIYRNGSRQIDLVIMDMIMPGLGGAAAIDAIRLIDPKVAVILASGYSAQGEAKSILKRGGHIRFVQKPFSLGEMSRLIRDMLDTAQKV